jgi:multidrug resistance efflux pump
MARPAAKNDAMQLSPRARRTWAYGIVLFFVVMCAAIALGQWWAIHKNVPSCAKRVAQGRHC